MSGLGHLSGQGAPNIWCAETNIQSNSFLLRLSLQRLQPRYLRKTIHRLVLRGSIT